MTAPTAAPRGLTPSETVYLHAERFARDAFLLDSATLLHTDAKVRATDLSTSLLAAALLAAEREGGVRLVPETEKRLFGLRKVEVLSVQPTGKDPGFPEGTLEARVVRLAAERARSVERVVHDALEEDASQPASLAVWRVQGGMEKAGLLEVEEKRRLKVFKVQAYKVPERTADLARRTPPDEVRALLEGARAGRAAEWALLERGIEKGVSGRKEVDHDGPDFD